MANPNRAMAYVPKRPYEQVYPFDKEYPFNKRSRGSAEEVRDRLKEAGWDAKVTSLRLGPRNDSWVEWRVWKREKPNANTST